MLYEIVNPSDSYTLEAETFSVAAFAILIFSYGQYGLRPCEELENQDSKNELPIFMFSNKDIIKTWIKENIGIDIDKMGEIEKFLEENIHELINILDSVVIGTKEERKIYKNTIKIIDDDIKKQKWIDDWNDTKRGSMNNIGEGLRSWSKELKKKIQKTTV